MLFCDRRLTVAEHLWFFAKIKNVDVPDKDLKAETDRSGFDSSLCLESY